MELADSPRQSDSRLTIARRRGENPRVAPARPRVLRLRLGSAELAVVSEPVSEGEHSKLTVAESDVLRRVLHGESNMQIAVARGSAVRTVANQVASIFRKLGVTSRGELVARCGGRCPPDSGP